MFSATYFTYDGISSETYGLVIADFDGDAVVETTAFSPTLNAIKPMSLNKFWHGGITYESAPQYQFSILSESEISVESRRQILSWLIGRNAFKRLVILQPDLERYYYNCVFTDADIIYINGRCHGFRVTANFDSPFARGEPTKATITAGTHIIRFINSSDVVDGYTYPVVSFTGGSIDIVNLTDDPNRHFTFQGLSSSETVTVDNESRHITSTLSGEKLSNFTSKQWLRLRKGVNELKITSTGKATITCPHYAMIGF